MEFHRLLGLPVVLILMGLVPGQVAVGQTRQSGTLPIFTLREVASNRVGVPPFPAEGVPQCDASGNVYFAVTSPNLSTKTILRISNDGEKAAPFVLPNDLGYGLWTVYISPSGTIYALFNGRHAHTLIEISESGEELRRTVWQVPEDLYVFSFAVLPGGRAMVRGELPLPAKPAPGDQKPVDPAASYTAWLAVDGRPIREINGATDKDQETIDAATAYRGSAIAPGPNETFVSILRTSLNVYSSAGALVHSSPIGMPGKDATPAMMQFADGLVAVGFEKEKQVEVPQRGSLGADEDGPTRKVTVLDTIWQLVSPEDGLSHGFFKMPDDFRGSSLCYLGGGNFLYLTMKDGHVVFVRARSN